MTLYQIKWTFLVSEFCKPWPISKFTGCYNTFILHKKWSFPLRISSVNIIPADLVTQTEEIFDQKLFFFCSDFSNNSIIFHPRVNEINSFLRYLRTRKLIFWWVYYWQQHEVLSGNTLRKICPYSEFFWPVFFALVLNTDQKNSEYRHFLSSDKRNIFNRKLRLTSLPNVLMSITLVNVSGVPRKTPYNITKTTIPLNLCKTGKMDMQTALQDRQMVTARFWSTL